MKSRNRSFISNLYAAIIAISTSITAFTVILSLPHGLIDQWKLYHWEENVKIVRFSTADYIVVYNDNPRPIFVNRYELFNTDLGVAEIVDVNQVIPANSYLNFKTEQHTEQWNKIFNGSREELKEIIQTGLNKLKSRYKFIVYDNEHYLFDWFKKSQGDPIKYPTHVKLLINLADKSFEKYVPSKGIIVILPEKQGNIPR